MSAIWQITLRVPQFAALAVGEAIEPFVDTVSVFEIASSTDWSVTAFVGHFPDHARIIDSAQSAALTAGAGRPDIDIAQCPDIDWLARNRESFPARRYGKFLIYGSYSPPPRPTGGHAIQIDSGRAFGSGTHGTTQGCLRALAGLARRATPDRVLDLGCGSGILAIAAARLWPRATITAIDIDPSAVVTARDNARINQVAHRVRCVENNGYPRRHTAAKQSFDLVIANILADPLITMAPQARRRVQHGGTIMLSGLLNHQAQVVARCYIAQGFRLKQRIVIEGWTTLVMNQPPGKRSQEARH